MHGTMNSWLEFPSNEKKKKIYDKVLNLREPKPSATYLENWNSHT
jgi:hypothetical protein